MKEIIATEEVINTAGTHIIKIVYHYADGTKREKQVFVRIEK
mgnify:CR=1 FL=1